MSGKWVPRIDLLSGPKYQRIVGALKADIQSGKLIAGSRLPAHRDLADRLSVSLGTITRAYSEAQALNLIVGEPGRGVYVSGLGAVAEKAYPTFAASEQFLDLRLNQPAIAPDGKPFSRLLGHMNKPDILERLSGYDFAPGAALYRHAGAQFLDLAGVKTQADQIVISNGAQQGLFAALSATTQPGDAVATEVLNYPGLFQIAEVLGLRLIAVDLDAQGMVPDSLEAAICNSGARVMVCTPRGHNPTTSVMSDGRLRSILSVANKHDITIIEDDVYGALFAGDFEPLFNRSEKVIYVSSLSKVVSPGLRLGIVAASDIHLEGIISIVRATSWSVSGLSAESFALLVKSEAMADNIDWHKQEIKERQTIVQRTLSNTNLSIADGCYHAWLSLPQDLSIDRLVLNARDRGLLLSNSDVFHIEGKQTHGLRLSLGKSKNQRKLKAAMEQLSILLAVDNHHSAMV